MREAASARRLRGIARRYGRNNLAGIGRQMRRGNGQGETDDATRHARRLRFASISLARDPLNGVVCDRIVGSDPLVDDRLDAVTLLTLRTPFRLFFRVFSRADP